MHRCVIVLLLVFHAVNIQGCFNSTAIKDKLTTTAQDCVSKVNRANKKCRLDYVNCVMESLGILDAEHINHDKHVEAFSQYVNTDWKEIVKKITAPCAETLKITDKDKVKSYSKCIVTALKPKCKAYVEIVSWFALHVMSKVRKICGSISTNGQPEQAPA